MPKGVDKTEFYQHDEAHATEFSKLGRIPGLKARMNADLHMGEGLKNTGQGNLFVIFGEPDITRLPAEGGRVQVKVNGVDVIHPCTGEVRSDGPDGIACWFIDSDYKEESFFVRHAYFLGPTIPMARSRPRSRPRSTSTRGRSCTATPRAPSPNPSPGALP